MIIEKGGVYAIGQKNNFQNILLVNLMDRLILIFIVCFKLFGFLSAKAISNEAFPKREIIFRFYKMSDFFVII